MNTFAVPPCPKAETFTLLATTALVTVIIPVTEVVL
jgi:hypothetical protein